MNNIFREKNKIIVVGDISDFHRLLSVIHAAINKASYTEIILDFFKCTSVFQNCMLSVCAQVMAYRNGGVDFKLIPPEIRRLENLFKNANWSHLIDPHSFDPSNFRGYTRIPATQYKNTDEQQIAVNKILNVILGAIPDMKREDFGAFEWAVNEITDNVLVHSKSSIGGLVQVSTFQRNKNQVQFVVADAGLGIPKTLKEGHPEITSDTEALDMAILEGVTRDKAIGQGNGLFGSYQICSKSKGSFSVVSGHASLEYTEKKGFSVSNENIPYSGTLVVATIDFSVPELLANALKFGGKKHIPVDFVETEYEKNDDNTLYFILRDEADSFGSRVSGKPVRTKLTNLLNMNSRGKVYIDLSEIHLISSSFADEAFGKLILEFGIMTFMKKYEFINVSETVHHLIDKAIKQRMSVGISD